MEYVSDLHSLIESTAIRKMEEGIIAEGEIKQGELFGKRTTRAL